ncbi:hypothetical protein [Streptomyces antimycoticus]|uniref:hypothetical protein n=1 Tax=Streptomyces antimycoticus TaxID=68175 RepID=UPI0034052676
MSTTRRAPKRKRNKRRAETEQMRTTRRDTLSILLSRAQRGVLSRDEAALLRTHVEAELAEGDAARASERGQQRAMERNRQRVEAADAAIVEAEERARTAEKRLAGYEAIFGPNAVDDFHAMQHRAKTAEQRLARIRDMADAWERRLPAAIRTATAADAIRRAANGDEGPVMFAVTPARAERSAEQADAVTAETKRLMERRTTTLRQRAEQAEDLLRAAHQCSNEAEQQRAAAEQRLAEQQQMHDDRRCALAAALAAHVDTPWPQLVELARQRNDDARANGEDCRAEFERARRLEGELAAVRSELADVKRRRDDARAGRQDAERALNRVRQADTLGAALAAVAEYDGLTPQAAAVQAALTDRADTLDARLAEQAREHAVELASARRATRNAEARVAELETRLANTRRYVDTAYDDDVCAGVRGDLRRLLDGEQPTYGAPVDPDAPIPYQLAAPAPAECRNPHLHEVTRPGPECQ